MFNKNCPSCGCQMEYKSKDSLNFSIKKSSMCRKCVGNIISEKMKGKPLSEEHKKKLSDVKKGTKLSEEHKKNIGTSCKGLKRSNESKKRYSESKMGDKNPAKRQEIRDKIRDSVIRKYKLNPNIKEKISMSLIKYFKENPNFTSFDELCEFEQFKILVWKLTNKNKKILLKTWNGLDYYDEENIKNNFNLDYNNDKYPTIDHKISILYGFKNKFNPEQIGSIDNLCFTKRIINGQKNILTENEFKIKLGN